MIVTWLRSPCMALLLCPSHSANKVAGGAKPRRIDHGSKTDPFFPMPSSSPSRGASGTPRSQQEVHPIQRGRGEGWPALPGSVGL
jgi:hypothetical protein